MEKMFVYPETLDSTTAGGMILEETEDHHSTAGSASYRCKLYRTVLEQRTASRQRLAGTRNEQSSNTAHA